MSELRGMAFVDGSYEGFIGTTATVENATDDTVELAVARALSSEKAETYTTSTSGQIQVTATTKSLIGGIGNWTTGQIEGATLWLESPSGVRLDSATAADAEGEVVFLTSGEDGGALLSFIVNSPQVGTWKYGYSTADENVPNMQISATTIADGGIDEMINDLGVLLGYEVDQHSTSDARSARSSFGCGLCKVATYGIALVIASVGAAALTTLTATSAVVVALTNLAAWITAPIAIAFLVGLSTAVGLTVGFVLTSLCDWLGAC